MQLARLFRSAVAERFHDDPEIHGHEGDKTIYRYPAVQYRWDASGPVIFTIGEAAEKVTNHPWPGSKLSIGGQRHEVLDVEWTMYPLRLEHSERLLHYTFSSPWLALNQENFRRWQKMSPADRHTELDRILVGNLLSLFKGLGEILPHGLTLYAAVESPREVSCAYKDVSLIGFRASFVTNFVLPADIAVGRAVSHGFGWIRRQYSSATSSPRPARRA